ncbi:serine hydrolase [Pseudofrankia sp. BMG5.37]|uniref:D-alanyl-D-alanine carboxypeptidase family protein n=1 Tax=Pseudofrankia sp. BMG5.37 TaxID=3050035 RepID=UPI00289624E3|nr:serine hydrolase [Pseudofrankia sp. BMG5.37]MDT3438472.1 serine hydrolase [Pseudofrankia sp. BMG5.37]
MSVRLVAVPMAASIWLARSAHRVASAAARRASSTSPALTAATAGKVATRTAAAAVTAVVVLLAALGLDLLGSGPAAASTRPRDAGPRAAGAAPLAAAAALTATPAPATPMATGQPPQAASPLPATLTAASWLVADAGTGEILAARGARVRDLPASTMKILTALVVLPALSPDLMVTVSKSAAEVDGTKVGLVPGQSYSVHDLATAMMIASGNDATLALVDAAGGRDVVLARMNALAAALGATDTVAVDPTGLDAPGQLTSVRDLAVLGRAAIAEPAVSRYLTIPRASLPTRDGGRFEIQNHNLLLGSYEGTLGVKNGYTVAADATYVGAVRRGGRTLVVALLRTAPNYGIDARALLDWGFANDGLVRPVGTLPARATGARPSADRARAGGALAGGGREDMGRAPAADGRPGSGHAAGRGIGWVTWMALGLTILASVLTALSHRRRRARARLHTPRARRPRHLAHQDGARHRQAQRGHAQRDRHRPPPAQPTPLQRPPAETNDGPARRRHREPGAHP